MRYIKPTDFKDVREFQQKYRQVENDITELIATGGGASTAGELQQLLSKALSQAMQFLTKVNKGYTQEVLPTAFEEGGKLTETPKMTKAEASAILERQGFKYSKRAFSRNTYIELQTATQAAGKGLKSRVNKIVDRLREMGEDSLYNVQQTILKDLQENGLLEVRYANGARQRLDTYAAMAARSARIETANIGAIGRALQLGTDLVKMTTMPQCCKLCGAYQDKVYSISGKDKRFPALFKTVLRRGYALPHPNCRHEFIPYFEEIEDPADVERMIKQSKIKYDNKGNLVDVRYQRDIELYQAWQAGNRQRNDELLEFEQMRAYYESRNEEPPYKTIGAFRTARRKKELSPKFKAWRYRNVDQNTLNRWKNEQNFRNCPKTLDELQEIKYNKPKQWEQMKRERKTIADINSKQWTPSFRQKAFDTYYHFREKGIEFTDHGVARFLARMTEKEFLEIHGKPYNYAQPDGRLVKYYNGTAIIYNQNTGEVVSIVNDRTKPRSDWDEI